MLITGAARAVVGDSANAATLESAAPDSLRSRGELTSGEC